MNRSDILDKAKACVCGDREQDYGRPEDNFRMIADLWATYIRKKVISNKAEVNIEPADVAVMMCLMKIARISSNPSHMDSWIDGCGYLCCGGELIARSMEARERV